MQAEKRFISSEILFSAMEELLAEDRQAVFTVTGMSMWPFLCHGRDQVVVEKCDGSGIKKGDIVLFKILTGKYFLHRITQVGDGWFESTGDGNCFRDGKFDNSCIQARVVRLIRDGETIECDSKNGKQYSACGCTAFQ